MVSGADPCKISSTWSVKRPLTLPPWVQMTVPMMIRLADPADAMNDGHGDSWLQSADAVAGSSATDPAARAAAPTRAASRVWFIKHLPLVQTASSPEVMAQAS